MPEVVEEKSIQTKVHEALERNGGDRVAAAAELGMTLGQLKNKLYECPTLRQRLAKDEMAPPDDIATLSRGVTTDEERLAMALKQEDQKLKKGVAGLGLTPREIETVMALQKFNRDNFAASLDIISAGVTRTAIKLMTQLEQVEARLEVVRYALIQMGVEMKEDRDLLVMEEEKLALQYTNVADLLRKILGTSFEGQKTLALIKFKLAGNGPKKRAKPAFQDIGSVVEVQQ